MAVTITNKYPGSCRVCETRVEVGMGVAVKSSMTGRWAVMHRDCRRGDGDAIAARQSVATAAPIERFPGEARNVPSFGAVVSAKLARGKRVLGTGDRHDFCVARGVCNCIERFPVEGADVDARRDAERTRWTPDPVGLGAEMDSYREAEAQRAEAREYAAEDRARAMQPPF